MKADIQIPVVKNVHVAVVNDWNAEFLDKEWNAFLINDRDTAIEMALVVSRGFDEKRKTSLFRHNLGVLEPHSYKKIELMQEAVLQMNNEFVVTFFADGKMFDKTYFFEKQTISAKGLYPIPVMEQLGILGV